MLGSVFSPWYARARRRGPADPCDHVALNVCLYGGARRWALTERPRAALSRDADTLSIGPSRLAWDGRGLTLDIAELGAPLPRPIRGTIRVFPEALAAQSFPLDAAGRHRWTPIAPRARVELRFQRPALSWSGDGYLDSNFGTRPLSDDFAAWTWSRGALRRNTVVLYDVIRRDGGTLSLALAGGADGDMRPIEAPPSVAVPPAPIWRMPRATRSDIPARVLRTLEDTPFYARSALATRLLGEDAVSVHESLSLDRFTRPWVQMLLPFKSPRAGR